jgi:hypothetical protein
MISSSRASGQSPVLAPSRPPVRGLSFSFPALTAAVQRRSDSAVGSSMPRNNLFKSRRRRIIGVPLRCPELMIPLFPVCRNPPWWNCWRTVGDDYEPRQFSTWAPAAIAMIGQPPATLDDRSVRIRLRRRKPTERIEGFRSDRTYHLKALARKAARWVSDHRGRPRTSEAPTCPGGHGKH